MWISIYTYTTINLVMNCTLSWLINQSFSLETDQLELWYILRKILVNLVIFVLPVICVQQDYNDALRELQSQLSNGISLKELQSSHITTNTTSVPNNREKLHYGVPSFHCRRHDVQKWLQKRSKAHSKCTTLPSSTLVDLVENFVGGDNVISWQSYHIGNHEIVVSNLLIRNLW